METRFVVLKLICDSLGVKTSVDSLSNRKTMQKAIYLTQEACDLPLGYGFNWYLLGPYSPRLAGDYYQLAETLATSDADFGQSSLRPEVREKLATLREYLDNTKPTDISFENWLELLASIHFLKEFRGEKPDKVNEKLKDQKPHLAEFSDAADRALLNLKLT